MSDNTIIRDQGGAEGADPTAEALRRIQEAGRSGQRQLDLSNLRLGPELSEKWPGWAALASLDHIRELRLDKNQISSIPIEGWNAIGQLVDLSWLYLGNNELVEIPPEGLDAVSRLRRLRWLDLSDNKFRLIPDAGWDVLGQLYQLTGLRLDGNRIVDIPVEGWQALGGLANLRLLYFQGNPFTLSDVAWDALGRLSNLEAVPLHLDQTGNSVRLWETLGKLTRLDFLQLSDGQISDMPAERWESLGRMRCLKYLTLKANGLTISATGWDALGQLVNLETLRLAWGMRRIPVRGWKALGRCINLKTLELSYNKIQTVPASGWDALSRLPKLEELDLARNNIRDIPLEGWPVFGGFRALKQINLSDNPLPEEVLAAARRGISSLLEYLEAARLRAAHPRTVKLMVLGEPASGKTTLIEALGGNTDPCDPQRPETVGVNVRRIEKKSLLDGRPLHLATWDFAGQHMEYATHQFFLKAGGVYLILWKARLGADYGQRDLWYWLELLHMRVKAPEFLLITTHTGSTPAALDLAAVQKKYPGCKGHYEVELSNRTGFTALEQKILELAAASPAMRAVWPGPWLEVRDAVRNMRAKTPYIPTETFWEVCAEKEVTSAKAQRDLADQLDTLGEIVFYPNEPLSRFVVLDPTWLTEHVARLVRDKRVRDNGGALDAADLERIWGIMPRAVRDHLENLMDEYDLVYRTSPYDGSQSSIVVEALPAAPEEFRSSDIARGRPQAEIIYRFPALVRHLPPGVPAWAFAGSRRYTKLGTRLWRNAAQFEDTETNSEAIVLSSEVDCEVRLRVAADYPPYFVGVLEGILRDTFKRYPGAQPESRIPCPCKPGCSYSHPRETVLKRKRDAKADITCPNSGEDVSIARLLEGFAVNTQAGVVAEFADMRRQLSAIQNAQNEELIKTCPSTFTLAPSSNFRLIENYVEYATREEEMELILYCEWDKGWHPTQRSVYRFQPEQEWFESLKTKWGQFASATKRIAPLVTAGRDVFRSAYCRPGEAGRKYNGDWRGGPKPDASTRHGTTFRSRPDRLGSSISFVETDPVPGRKARRERTGIWRLASVSPKGGRKTALVMPGASPSIRECLSQCAVIYLSGSAAKWKGRISTHAKLREILKVFRTEPVSFPILASAAGPTSSRS